MKRPEDRGIEWFSDGQDVPTTTAPSIPHSRPLQPPDHISSSPLTLETWASVPALPVVLNTRSKAPYKVNGRDKRQSAMMVAKKGDPNVNEGKIELGQRSGPARNASTQLPVCMPTKTLRYIHFPAKAHELRVFKANRIPFLSSHLASQNSHASVATSRLSEQYSASCTPLNLLFLA